MVIKIIQTPDGPRLWDTNRSKLKGSPPRKPRAPKSKTMIKPIVKKSTFKPFTRPVTNYDFTQPVYEPVEIESHSVTIASQKFEAIKENSKVEVIKESINEELKETKVSNPIISRATRLEVNKLIDVDEKEGLVTHRLPEIGKLILSGHAIEQPERSWLSVIASGTPTPNSHHFTYLGEYDDYEEAMQVILVEMQEILVEEEFLREYLRDQKFEDKLIRANRVHADSLQRNKITGRPEAWFRVPGNMTGEPRYVSVSLKDNHTLSIRFEPLEREVRDTSRDGEVDFINAVRPYIVKNFIYNS